MRLLAVDFHQVETVSWDHLEMLQSQGRFPLGAFAYHNSIPGFLVHALPAPRGCRSASKRSREMIQSQGRFPLRGLHLPLLGRFVCVVSWPRLGLGFCSTLFPSLFRSRSRLAECVSLHSKRRALTLNHDVHTHTHTHAHALESHSPPTQNLPPSARAHSLTPRLPAPEPQMSATKTR